MPGHVATATVSPAKMRGKNLRFFLLPHPYPARRYHPVAADSRSLTPYCTDGIRIRYNRTFDK